MSDLRTRIAAALKKQAEFRGVYKIADFDYRFLADAVIRELGLKPETTYRGWTGGDLPVRYVTDWEPPIAQADHNGTVTGP